MGMEMTDPDKIKLARATEAALEALKKAGPSGVTTMEGIAVAGTRFPARVHELRGLGYLVKVERVPGDRMVYRYALLGFQASPQLLLFKAA